MFLSSFIIFLQTYKSLLPFLTFHYSKAIQSDINIHTKLMITLLHLQKRASWTIAGNISNILLEIFSC